MSTEQIDAHWTTCDSMEDLRWHIDQIPDVLTTSVIGAYGANRWGYLLIAGQTNFLIPVAYTYMGLEPKAIKRSNMVLVGINEEVIGYKLPLGDITFTYVMPTVFHEFVCFGVNGFIVRDETGFVGLSYEGVEKWVFCQDIIASYSMSGSTIVGTTIEGAHFSFEVPEYESVS